ncbi:MAG: ABC transporter permease [Nanoarchaeota archaeon]
MINYLKFGIKNLKRRGLRSWLTLLGIVIGITSVVALISLGSGLQEAVNSQFGVSSTQIITIQAGGLTGYGPPGTGIDVPLTTDDSKAIEKISGVEYAIPRNIRQIKTTYNDITRFVYSGSMPEDNFDQVYETLDLEIEKGRKLKESDSKKVLLGYNFMNKDKNGFEKEISPGKKIEIQGKSFEVIGIVKKQGSFILDNVLYLNEDEMENLLEYGNEVDLIAVKVRNKEDIPRVKEKIEKLMRDRRDVKKGQEDFSIETPEATLETVNEVLSGVKIFIVIIASISLIVGAVGIANTMTTSVLERTKEIGILKSVGARNENIFFQFLVESGLLGLIGGIFGTLFGLTIGYFGIYGINNFIGSEINLNLDWIFILSILSLSFLIGSISGIIPALQAAKKNPVEAIRR